MSTENMFPLDEDIKMFHIQLTTELGNAAREVEDAVTPATWRSLCNLLLVKIMAFNARRPLEPGLITIQQYDKRIRGCNTKVDLVHMLNSKEKEIAKSMDVVKVLGKYDRVVPILLTQRLVQCIDLLNRTRQEARIPKENKYVFPQGNDRPIHAGKVMRQIMDLLKTKCNFARPELITAKQFRRVLASYVQSLNLQDRDIENLCGHLGHDVRTHLHYYRLHSDAAELAKVGKILLLVESGQVEKHTGKLLADIEVSSTGK